MIDRIERTRLPDGELPALSKSLLTQLGTIGQACSLSSGGPAVGEDLVHQLHGLQNLLKGDGDIPSLAAGMNQVLTDAAGPDGPDLDDIVQAVNGWTAEALDAVNQRIGYLNQSLQSSARSVSAFYETKANINLAAVDVLAAAIAACRGDPGKPEAALSQDAQESLKILRNAQETFEQRCAGMTIAAERSVGEVAGADRFDEMGTTKKLSGFGKLQHPLAHRAETAARRNFAAQIAAGEGTEHLDTPGTSEMAVVEEALHAVLKQAGMPGAEARGAIEHAFQEVVDWNSKWQQTIAGAIHLPVKPELSGSQAADGQPVFTSDHPLLEGWADLLSDTESADEAAGSAGPQATSQPVYDHNPMSLRAKVVHSEISPAAVFFKSYEGRGFNAHRSTESGHAVNLALTQLKDSDGNTLMFSGVRHGVLSAFGITHKGLPGMTDHELRQHIETLVPMEEWSRISGQPVDHEAIRRNPTDPASKRQKNEALAATARAIREQPAEIDKLRARANLNRAKEVVALAVASDPALMELARQGRSPSVQILSLSLLTPDSFRTGVNDNESLMVADQAAVWQALSGGEQEIQLPDGGPPVKVHITAIPMNYGVNVGAVQGVAGVHTDAVSGWGVSDALNGPALRALFGDDLTQLSQSRTGVFGEGIRRLENDHRAELQKTADRLRQTEEARGRQGRAMQVAIDSGSPDALQAQSVYQSLVLDEQELRAKLQKLQSAPDDQSTPLGAALEIARQIEHIHNESAHRKAGSEPYKMPTRLAVLGNLLGVKVAFNCKSGKDRTGELDAEIKHFTSQIQITGRVPHYTRTRTPEEVRQFHEIVTNCGNFEMQRLNTGFAGYKLTGLNALYRQFGGQDKHDGLTRNFLGLSGLTAS